MKEVMDLTLYDEASQLRDGLNIRKGIFPSAQASPIYSVWYAFLSIFASNNIDLYYINWYTLTIALPTALYFLLIAMRLNPLMSYAISMIFLYSRFNYPLWPKTNNFGLLMIILVSLIAIKLSLSTLTNKIDFYSFLFFVGAYLRPEFLISGIFYVVFNLKNFKLKLNIQRLLYLFISFTLIQIFGIPFGNRLTGAFGQHFAVNYVEKNNLDIIAWDSFNSIITETFQGGENLIDYFIINPQAFLSHVFFNMQRIPVSFLSYFKPYNEEFYFLLITIFSIIFIFLRILIYYKKDIFKEISKDRSISRFLNSNTNKVFISIVLPYFITASLIFPRGHYFLYIFIGLLLITTYNFRNFLNPPFENLSKKVTLVFVILLASVTHVNTQDKNDLYVLEISNFINNYVDTKDNSSVSIFSGDGNYCIYVNVNCEHNPGLGSSSDYLLYLQQNKIDILIISDRLLKSNEIANPGGPLNLKNNLSNLGYINKKNIWETEIFVLNN